MKKGCETLPFETCALACAGNLWCPLSRLKKTPYKNVFEYIYNIDIDIQCYYGLPLGCTGGDTCCTAINPCGVDQGDCDTTDQCKTGLKCGTDNCSIKTGLEWDAEDDCCYTPGAIEMIF